MTLFCPFCSQVPASKTAVFKAKRRKSTSASGWRCHCCNWRKWKGSRTEREAESPQRRRDILLALKVQAGSCLGSLRRGGTGNENTESGESLQKLHPSNILKVLPSSLSKIMILKSLFQLSRSTLFVPWVDVPVFICNQVGNTVASSPTITFFFV